MHIASQNGEDSLITQQNKLKKIDEVAIFEKPVQCRNETGAQGSFCQGRSPSISFPPRAALYKPHLADNPGCFILATKPAEEEEKDKEEDIPLPGPFEIKPSHSTASLTMKKGGFSFTAAGGPTPRDDSARSDRKEYALPGCKKLLQIKGISPERHSRKAKRRVEACIPSNGTAPLAVMQDTTTKKLWCLVPPPSHNNSNKTEMLASTTEQVAVTGTSGLVSSASNGSIFLDSEFRYILLPVVYGIIFILGLFANLYVLFVLRCLREAKAMGEIRIYMTNLTIADLLFVCALPFWIDYYSRHGNWVYTDFMCRLTGSLFFINTYGSILFLGAISVNRYWAVTRPLDAASSNHRRRGIIVCIVIWSEFRSETIISRKSNRTMSSSTKRPRGVKRRALQMLLAVVGVFVVCFLPHHIIQGFWTLAVLQITQGWGHVDWDQKTLQALNDAHQLTLVLMALNCILDPVVYYFATRKFRRFITAQFKKVVRGEGCSQTLTSQLSMESRNNCQRLNKNRDDHHFILDTSIPQREFTHPSSSSAPAAQTAIAHGVASLHKDPEATVHYTPTSQSHHSTSSQKAATVLFGAAVLANYPHVLGKAEVGACLGWVGVLQQWPWKTMLREVGVALCNDISPQGAYFSCRYGLTTVAFFTAIRRPRGREGGWKRDVKREQREAKK
ncbi:hypothetical protein FQN60_008826 [Etheostoma spectabile]|uniref:Platelet-activating factor receptor n=1 Tax=Etheostoma spectabile TaxID=54343 RepID=A0A5J5CN79_9PERO|nr:hypothetical protein FQN60_008826 [Etheostoma spectabile]